MNIDVVQNQNLVPIDSLSVEKLVTDFSLFHNVTFDEAAIHFVDTSTICDLHRQFFDDPSTTDCISFPIDDEDEEDYRILGEVFVCPETAANYVKIHGGNVYHEVTLYIIHGMLHLFGYDDIDDNDRKMMRDEEARYLKHIAAKGLWIHS